MAGFRLLPLTMVMATAMLGVKAMDIAQGSNQLSNSLVSDATAEEKTAPKEEAKKEDAKPVEEKKDAAKEEGKAAEGEHGKKEDKNAKPSAVSETAPDTVKLGSQSYTPSEIDMLQNLAKRREELEQWSSQLEMKDNVLTATEQRIDQKLSDMQNLQKQVNVLLAAYNQQEDAKIKSLVKIYENMKPGDAARIFEETDMPVLLSIIDKMSERKVAPVLAAMNPKKAQAITAELAAQRRVQPVPQNVDAATSPSPSATSSPSAAASANSNPTKPAASENSASPASATKPASGESSTTAPASTKPAAVAEKADAKAAEASSPAPASTAPAKAPVAGSAADPAKTTTK